MSNEELPEEHPAYGCIEVIRVSGGDSKLFGSKAPHNHRVSLRIREAERSDSDSRAHFPRDRIVEVEMSYHQFGRLMSAMDRGGGIPCTIRRKEGGNGGGSAVCGPGREIQNPGRGEGGGNSGRYGGFRTSVP